MGRRVAVVTGATRGIGRAAVSDLAARGYRLGVLGRDAAKLAELAHELGGADVVTVCADVLDRQAVRDGVAEIVDALGTVDLLVNNAGVIEQQELDFVADDLDDLWRVVEVNVRGVLEMAAAVLPTMLSAGQGRIVNVTSGAAYSSMNSYTGYGISKAGVSRFSWLLAHQYRERGIRVLDIAPGVVKTDMTLAMPAHNGRTEWTNVADVTELVGAFGAGELDEISGRFVRAGVDTVASLRLQAAQIRQTDARRLRISRYGADDPIN